MQKITAVTTSKYQMLSDISSIPRRRAPSHPFANLTHIAQLHRTPREPDRNATGTGPSASRLRWPQSVRRIAAHHSSAVTSDRQMRQFG